MKALDITREIQRGCEKRDVNRVIHKMKEVEDSHFTNVLKCSNSTHTNFVHSIGRNAGRVMSTVHSS